MQWLSSEQPYNRQTRAITVHTHLIHLKQYANLDLQRHSE